MRRTLVLGGSVAVLAGIASVVGSWLSLGLNDVLLGAALGAALALIPVESHGRRLASFLVGFLVAWAGYAVRAAALPDISAARALVVFGSVLVIAVLCAGSRGRLPFWSALLGAAAMTGAYEFVYAAAPYNFLAESVSTATQILVAVAFGFVVALIVPLVGGERSRAAGAEPSAEPQADEVEPAEGAAA